MQDFGRKEGFPSGYGAGTLSSCMDVAVRTGSTKAPRDVSLVTLSLESLHGERVCLLMEITAREKGALSVERECEAIVKHALLEAEGDAPQRLDSTLKELNGLLKGMLVSGAIHDVHMVISIVDLDDTLHVSHAGRAEAYLIRKGSASQITEYSGRPTPAFVHIASGRLERGDLVIFSTQRLLRALTPAQLGKLTADRDMVLESVARALEAEEEHAALCVVDVGGTVGRRPERDEDDALVLHPRSDSARNQIVDRRRRTQGSGLRGSLPSLSGLSSYISLDRIKSFLPSRETVGRIGSTGRKMSKGGISRLSGLNVWSAAQDGFRTFVADLTHPQRKKRAHLLLLASAIAALIIIWALVHVFTSSQRSKTRTELETLVEQISTEIQTAENKRIIGDTESANAILVRAEERAKQVLDNESGLFRVEANELLGRIRSKKEEINNIIRLASPRVVANLSANNSDIVSQGLIGIGDGEFVVYDRQDLYRVLLNSVESPDRLSEDVLILDGANLSRFSSLVFLMNGNSIIEWQNGQAISMKTDDTRGWVNGKAVDAYLRFVYLLSPENKQIYKYERLGDRYGAPVEYNVNGDLTGAIDMAIDGNVFILKRVTGADGKEDGTILKLFRGEAQPFVIRKAPPGVFATATKMYKVTDRHMYLLDPENARVIMITDGGTTGESSYVRQYVFEGDQVGTLKDLYVNSDESQLYVLDEKKIYVVDLTAVRAAPSTSSAQ